MDTGFKPPWEPRMIAFIMTAIAASEAFGDKPVGDKYERVDVRDAEILSEPSQLRRGRCE